MGKPTTTSDDLAVAVAAGSLTATGRGNVLLPILPSGNGFNVSVTGTFVGSVQLEWSFDGGATWSPLSYATGQTITWTTPAGMTFINWGRGILYSINCTAYTSGTINYRLSQ
jgi:hypothetical protein